MNNGQLTHRPSLRNIAASIFFLVSSGGIAQQLVIGKTEIRDNKIVLHYNITDTVAGKFYTVRVYSSQDNYMHPLTRVDGDAGIGLRPGFQKKLVWDPKELGDKFDGKVALELRANVYIPFVHFEGFHDSRQIKRLKPYALTWRGGSPQNVLNVDVFRKGDKIVTFPNIANAGQHTLTLPKHVRPGNHYRLRISDSKNKDEVVFTEEFRVRRKFPLVLKSLSAIALAGTLYMLVSPEKKPSPLPSPLLPE